MCLQCFQKAAGSTLGLPIQVWLCHIIYSLGSWVLGRGCQPLHLSRLPPKPVPRRSHPTRRSMCTYRPKPSHLRAGAGQGITHGWLQSNRQRCLICLFHVYSWRTLTEGYGSIRELSAGGLIVRISEPHSNETYWGCLMLPILMYTSEMNKASSRGKNNNNKRMKRGRRNQGGAQCAMLSSAGAQLLQRCSPSTWVLTSVPLHRPHQLQTGDRKVLLSNNS